MKKHYSKLPPVFGPYERIPDDAGRRMVRCLVDGAEIPSLGIAYHERGTRHQIGSEAVGRSKFGDLSQSVRPTEWRTSSTSLTPYGRRLRIGQLKKLLAVRPLSADESAEYARLVSDEREGKEETVIANEEGKP